MTAIPDPASGDEILATWGQAVADWANLRAAIIAATGSIAATETQVVGVTLPAGTLLAGTAFRLEGWGIASNSGATPRALTLRCRIGPTTLTGNIAVSRAPTINTTAAGEGFRIEMLFTIRTVGATGTCIAQAQQVAGSSEPLNNATWVTSGSSTVVVDTTVANILELTAVTAHAEGTCNFYLASIERVA